MSRASPYSPTASLSTNQAPYSPTVENSAASSTASLLSPSSRGPVPATSSPHMFSRSQGRDSVRSINSAASFGTTGPTGHSLSDKFSLSPDPSIWIPGSQQEPDDYLHNPDPRRDHKNDKGGTIFTPRGIANLGCLTILVAGLLTLFAGYPLISYFTRDDISTLGAFNLGGTNASGQVPELIGNRDLIDIHTPLEVYTKTAMDGTELELVFSDEFNVDGRTFYPGDDPYWEAADLHYWGTNNLEWYDPKALITENGALKVTLSKELNHNLNYTGGLMSTWNKFCFTGGRIEVAVQLPGSTDVEGLWPAVWTMGNLGRVGYGATLDGMWPYTYDSCDVGTLPNQTHNGLPIAATINGDPGNGDVLSYLPGQRLSACTCLDQSHPGPLLPEGRLRGRAAPEIDIIEAQIDGTRHMGTVSQSGQWAPFDESYTWHNTTDNYEIYTPESVKLNEYKGGVFQQATSGLADTNQACYELSPQTQAGNGCFAVYGYEYVPDREKGYITWINDDKPSWTIKAAGMGPNDKVNIGQRIIPEEPMYLIINLGISKNFGFVDFDNLVFPTHMLVDWIRVYQPKGKKNIGCDPPDYPTQAYINTYIEAYSNPNLTTWVDDYKQTVPKNKLLDGCAAGQSPVGGTLPT